MSLNFVYKHDDIKPKGAVLLFHGLTGSPFELKKYGLFLYNNGYDVYADSLPGHGDRYEEIYTVKYTDWTSFARDSFLKLKSQYENVFVCGLCLGAVLAIYLGEVYKKELSGIVALSTTLFLDGWRLPWYSFLLPVALCTIMRFYFSYPECEPHGIKNEKVRAVIKKLLEKGDVGMNDFPMSGIYELMKLSKFVRKNLKNVEAPILLIHSLEDDLTSIKSDRVVYDNILSTDKEQIILKDSYHMILYDNEKQFVYDKSLGFIDARIKTTKQTEEVCLL